jgi:hypothetical protein
MGVKMFFDKPENKVKKEDLIPRSDYEHLKQIVKNQQEYLNNLYIFYKLNPTPFLKNLRDLSYELMRFFDNVCKKHNLDYWLCYGILLGAVRHEDFVPWDDDLDVGMMRADYIKLVEVFEEEINLNNATNVSCAFKIDKRDKVSKRWFQINYHHPDLKGKVLGIDVFPFDYVNEVDETFEDRYYQARQNFYKRRDKNDDFKDAVDKLYEELNLSMEKTPQYVAGVESVHGKMNIFSFNILESDNLYPFQTLQFGKYSHPAPRDSNLFLRDIYGKSFMKIPKKMRDHGRLNRYRDVENIEEIFEKASKDLENTNNNFK